MEKCIFKFEDITREYCHFFYKDYHIELIISYNEYNNYSTEIIFNIIYNNLFTDFCYYNTFFDISNILYKLHNPIYYRKYNQKELI